MIYKKDNREFKQLRADIIKLNILTDKISATRSYHNKNYKPITAHTTRSIQLLKQLHNQLLK